MSANPLHPKLLLAFADIIYIYHSSSKSNADALSRLPLPTELGTQPALPEMVLLFQHLDDSPVIAKQIAEETRKDSVLSIVELYSRQGLSDSIDSHPELRPYFDWKLELSVEQHYVMWGSRVII